MFSSTGNIQELSFLLRKYTIFIDRNEVSQPKTPYDPLKPLIMDFDALLKQIQDWTNKIPLLILGSGSSIPFGIPSMWGLGEYLKRTMAFSDPDDNSQFKEFVGLLDSLKDLELALQRLHDIRPKVLEEIIQRTWEIVNETDLNAYESLIHNKDTFPLAELTKYLLTSTDKKLSIITTNYDRLAEYAASIAGAFICNGFAQNYFGQFTDLIHKNNVRTLFGYTGQVNIWKVHGSLEWFQSMDEESIQLPLRKSIPIGLKPSIVTPGLTKYFQTQLEPFRTIFTEADNEIVNANGFLCIGYGFNDIHVQPKLIAQIKKHKPIIVLAKEITVKTKEAIIDNKCGNYILIEEYNSTDSRIYSSQFSGPKIFKNKSCWMLAEYLKLIKS